MDERIFAFYNSGQNEWDKLLEGMSPSDIQFLSNEACAIAQWMALFSVYLGYRGGFGTGDHGHEIALKAMAMDRMKIRRALGYSYP
jgi:hypothetical protein